jgi:hypothetical protein
MSAPARCSRSRGCTLTRARSYETWFQAACELLFSKVAPGQFAIFYQTDIKMVEGAQVRARSRDRALAFIAHCTGAPLAGQVLSRVARCARAWIYSSLPQSRALLQRLRLQKRQIRPALLQPRTVFCARRLVLGEQRRLGRRVAAGQHGVRRPPHRPTTSALCLPDDSFLQVQTCYGC